MRTEVYSVLHIPLLMDGLFVCFRLSVSRYFIKVVLDEQQILSVSHKTNVCLWPQSIIISVYCTYRICNSVSLSLPRPPSSPQRRINWSWNIGPVQQVISSVRGVPRPKNQTPAFCSMADNYSTTVQYISLPVQLFCQLLHSADRVDE